MTDELPWWQKLLKLEPAMVRAALVALSGILALILGNTVFDETAVNAILEFYTSVSALVAAFFIRPAVTANAKVIVRDDTPLSATPTIVAGEAVTDAATMPAVVEAAQSRSAS